MGWPVDDVERRVTSRVKKDLFGMFDLLAITPGGFLGIQVTTGSNHAARVKKIRASEFYDAWKRHGTAEVWSWSEKKKTGWTMRREVA